LFLEEEEVQIMSQSNKTTLEKPIGNYCEHPDWFQPQFEQMDARRVPWQKVDARTHEHSLDSNGAGYSLVFNQVAEKIAGSEAVGVDLLLLRFSPQLEEMEACSDAVIARKQRTVSGSAL
jgi:hypothetical protein